MAVTPAKSALDDMEFWLSSSSSAVPSSASAAAIVSTSPPKKVSLSKSASSSTVVLAPVAAPVVAAAPPEKKKSKSKDKEKETVIESKDEKKKAKKSSKDKEEVVTAPVPPTPASMLPTTHRPLAADSVVTLTYDTLAVANAEHRAPFTVVVSLLLKNVSATPVTKLEFSLVESAAAKVVGTRAESIVVPFDLPGGAVKEQKMTFALANNTMPVKMRGSLSYMVRP